MNKPWAAEQLIDQEQAKQLIEAQFPKLKPVALTPLGEGWDNVAYRVNNDYVFRFPRRQLAVDFLNDERKLLPSLYHRLCLPIPKPEFCGNPSPTYQWPFLGYRFMPGQSACKVRLSLRERTLLAAPLAQFLSSLHAISEQEALALGAKPDPLGRLDISLRWPKAYETITNLVSLGLPVDSKRLLERLDSLATIHDTGQRVLVHGDMYARHILIDQHKNISGIIDWGDIHIAHPAIDLMLIFSFLPQPARNIFIDTYGPIDNLTLQLALFKAIEHTSIMLLYGYDIQDQDLITEGLFGLKLITEC